MYMHEYVMNHKYSSTSNRKLHTHMWAICQHSHTPSIFHMPSTCTCVYCARSHKSNEMETHVEQDKHTQLRWSLLTSFGLWKALVQKEDNFLHKVSDVLSILTSHQHCPVVSVTFWGWSLSPWSRVAKNKLHLNRLWAIQVHMYMHVCIKVSEYMHKGW